MYVPDVGIGVAILLGLVVVVGGNNPITQGALR